MRLTRRHQLHSTATARRIHLADLAHDGVRHARDSGGAVIVDSDGNPVPAEDINGPIVHPTVRLAVLVELSSQFRFREGEGTDNVVTPDAGYGYVLNKASTALLTPLRRPTVA